MSTVPQPDAATILARAHTEGEWLVPVEMVLACTASKFADVVKKRFARGDYPKPAAKVFLRGDHWFGIVEFRAEKYVAILMPLDLWTMEGRR